MMYTSTRYTHIIVTLLLIVSCEPPKEEQLPTGWCCPECGQINGTHDKKCLACQVGTRGNEEEQFEVLKQRVEEALSNPESISSDVYHTLNVVLGRMRENGSLQVASSGSPEIWMCHHCQRPNVNSESACLCCGRSKCNSALWRRTEQVIFMRYVLSLLRDVPLRRRGDSIRSYGADSAYDSSVDNRRIPGEGVPTPSRNDQERYNNWRDTSDAHRSISFSQFLQLRNRLEGLLDNDYQSWQANNPRYQHILSIDEYIEAYIGQFYWNAYYAHDVTYQLGANDYINLFLIRYFWNNTSVGPGLSMDSLHCVLYNKYQQWCNANMRISFGAYLQYYLAWKEAHTGTHPVFEDYLGQQTSKTVIQWELLTQRDFEDCEQKCPICLNPVKTSEEARSGIYMCPGCKGGTCKPCLEACVQSNHTQCALCRAPIAVHER